MSVKSFVVVLVTGFVLFTLFVNAPTMGILMHLLGIDKLEPAELAIRNRVMASSLANIGDSVRGFALRCLPAITRLSRIGHVLPLSSSPCAATPPFYQSISGR